MNIKNSSTRIRANNLIDLGGVPDHLPALIDVEEMLISQVHKA